MYPDTPIPTIRIDVSQPPETRYEVVCDVFGPAMRNLTPILDDLLRFFIPPPWGFVRIFIQWMLRIVARRMSSWEETRELEGISKRTGVELHFLVVLNVLLDCMMGCTSGAAAVHPSLGREKGARGKGKEQEINTGNGEGRYSLRQRKPHQQPTKDEEFKEQIRLMHFRTLDWGMDELRALLVVLEYVDSTSEKPDHVIARSITYAGFVGVLTGVREGLSLSLNFRPNHLDGVLHKLRLHQLGVLIGLRPSASSLLRSIIIPESLSQDFQKENTLFAEPAELSSKAAGKQPQHSGSHSLEHKAEALSKARFPPCYITLCDGSQVCVIEKDLETGVVTTSNEWAVITNHDVATRADKTAHGEGNKMMEDWLAESEERRGGIQRKWDDVKNSKARKGGEEEEKQRARRSSSPSIVSLGNGESQGDPEAERNGVSSGDGDPNREQGGEKDEDPAIGISAQRLKSWVEAYPIMNEYTHFACIMDPRRGNIKWLERGLLDVDDSSVPSSLGERGARGSVVGEVTEVVRKK